MIKSLIPVLFFFFLLPSIQTNAQSYAFDVNVVYKSDTAGNVIWARDFSGKVNPASIDSNKVWAVNFDGKYVFIRVMQDHSAWNTIGDFYSSVFVLDTLGNTISQKNELFPSFCSYEPVGSWPSLRNGVWMATDVCVTSMHYAQLVKIDSTAGISQSGNRVALSWADNNRLHTLKNTIDSNYIYLGDYNSSTGQIPFILSLGKINETGQILWKHEYEGDSTMDENFYATGMAIDSLNNIYIIGGYQSWILQRSGLFTLKLNQNGIVQNAHLYTDFQFPPGGPVFTDNVSIQDTLIHVTINDTIYLFDKNFSNACLNSLADFKVRLLLSTAVFAQASANYLTTNFMPDTISYAITPTNTNILTFSCYTTGQDEIQNEKINLLPNPFIDVVKITADNIIKQISVFDTFGKLIIERNINANNTGIDLSEMTNSIYTISIEMKDGNRYNRKIIKVN